MYFEISTSMEYQAALYIRLSKEDENLGPSGSVINQEALLREFVDKNKIRVYDTYVDDGWSGTNFDRPDFMRMIADIEAKKVNMVITKDLSRLGRDYILTGHYLEKYFPEKRVRYISLLDGIDTGVESSANDITPFKAIMNDMYAKDISKKIKSVKRDKQQKGKYIGWKPIYGYEHHPEDKNRIIVDDGAAGIVRRMFTMALSGTSCRQIAATFNEEKIASPSTYKGVKVGNPGPYTGLWNSTRVAEMLRNEMYIGNMVQGRMVKTSYKLKNCQRQPKEKWVIVENTHEPLVDKETFYKVQELLDSRKTTRERKYDYLLKGIVCCHECGYPLGVINRKNAKGEDVLYFVCRTYQRFTKAGVCTSHSIKEEKVTEAVLKKIKEVCERYMNRDKYVSVAEEAIEKNSQTKNFENEMSVLEKRKITLTDNLDKIYMDRLSGVLSDDDFERIYSKVKSERKSIEERLVGLKVQMTQPEDYRKKANQLVENFISSASSNRELIVSLAERVELTKDKELIIKFKFKELNDLNSTQNT